MRVIKITPGSPIPKNYTGIIEYIEGNTQWRKNGELHRVEGPALIGIDVNFRWWCLFGERMTEKEHTKRTVYMKTTLGKLLWRISDEL